MIESALVAAGTFFFKEITFLTEPLFYILMHSSCDDSSQNPYRDLKSWSSLSLCRFISLMCNAYVCMHVCIM